MFFTNRSKDATEYGHHLTEIKRVPVIPAPGGSSSSGPDSPALDGVFQHQVDPRAKHHQAGKPLPLMVDLLKIAPVAGVLADPFTGSGTTGLACAELGLGFVGVELDAGYHAMPEERVRAANDGLAWSAASSTDEELGPDLIGDLFGGR